MTPDLTATGPLGLALDQIVVIVVLGAMMAALLTKRVSPAQGVVGALLALFLLHVIDAGTAFVGFANPAPITIAALYVVAAGVERTGALLPALRLVLGSRNLRSALWRLCGSVGALSAFVANTPLVAMLISPVRSWADGRRVPDSKLLIPLSYATIAGGNITLLGTSTTLVASGLLIQTGLEPYGFWEPTRLGLPFALAAIVVLTMLAPALMPDRGGTSAGVPSTGVTSTGLTADAKTSDGGGVGVEQVAKPFTVSLSVDPAGSLDGLTVLDGGLRSLPSTYLVAIERDGETITPVAPTYLLRGGDVLRFAGRVEQMLDIDRHPGMTLVEQKHLWSLDDDQHAWFEAIIGPTSPLVGRTIKQSDFRLRYQAAVVGISRAGEDLDAKLGDVRLQVGDSLLVVSDMDFRSRWHHHSDFLFIHQRSEAPPTAQTRSRVALAILAVVVVLPMLGVLDVLRAAVAGAVATVLSGVLTPRQAREAVALNVVVMIGAAIGLGAAVDATGLADRLAAGLSDLVDGRGAWGAAVVVVLATLLLTEVISNAAAIAVMLPIALAAGAEAGADPRRFALGVTLAASSSFLTPIGYQTNTMVFGPGRYHPADYLRLGIPLAVIVAVMAPVFMASGW